MTLQELYREDDRVLAEYEKFEELEALARRRADFRLAAEYEAILDSLEDRVEEAMHRQSSLPQ